MRRLVASRALAGVALAGLVSAAPFRAQVRGPTTVILVRHAEKAAEPADDPPLTGAGEARARALVDATRDAGVQAIITTQFVRTKATAQPVSAALGLSPEVVDARGPKHAQDVAEAILVHHAGETVLVVGHSNSVPAIIAALGANRPPPICDSQYDNLFIVTVPETGQARVIRAKYGAASPPDPACAAMR
jgi:broad specificity phosphatase PhoE